LRKTRDKKKIGIDEVFNGCRSRHKELSITFVTSFLFCFFASTQNVRGADFSSRSSGEIERQPAASSRESLSSSDVGGGHLIKSIEIFGLKRIEKGAFLGKLGSKVGSVLSADQLKKDFQALHAMGFFDELEAFLELGGKLVFHVKERPVVSKIDFEGNERISTSDLKDVVKLKEWSILDINKVKDDVALLQKHYEDKGFYLAKINFELSTPSKEKPDEVRLVFKIDDFDKVQIKKITFLNNKHFSDEQLKSIFQETKEGGLLSFLGGSGSFKESAFKQDLQRLTYWYLEHGYVKFRFENPVVTISEDKKWLFVSLYLEEGDQFRIGSIDFSGDVLFPKSELSADLGLQGDSVFSISKRNGDIQKLSEKYEDLGYAYVNVVPKMAIRDEAKLVDIDYTFEKGSLVYIGEINVVGNSKTHDKVIRRELKIKEGELFHGTNFRQSRENVERLGYFAPGEVIFNRITPPGKTDVVNVEIQVKERSTGTITLGAGLGSVQGFFFTSTISEINFMGKGQTISLAAQYAADNVSKSFNLGFTDPYAFDTRWSAGFDLYWINFPIPRKYLTRKLGFNLRAGYPVAEFVNAFVTYKAEGLQITNEVPGLPPELVDPDRGALSSFVFSVVRDKRNNRFETSDGNYQSLSFEFAGIGTEQKKFVKMVANNRFYKRLIGDLVFRNSTEIGFISPWGGVPLPPAEKFYLGGPNNMKGFPLFLLGPTQTTSDGVIYPLGGTTQAYSLVELEHPLIKDAGLKFVTFFDIGNAFDPFPGWANLSLRADAGFGIRWFSPIGPLRFEWGFPLQRQPNEESPTFIFFIGPPF
jgi:outer membrane protein insertion porin family